MPSATSTKLARTKTFEHTISGLLSKRADLLGEAQVLRDRLAEIRNDIDALDRTLAVLGYDGDLDAMMPRQKRHVLFGRGELSRQVFQVLREAGKPLTSRQWTQGGSEIRRCFGVIKKRDAVQSREYRSRSLPMLVMSH